MKTVVLAICLLVPELVFANVCDGTQGSFEFERSVTVGTRITYFYPYVVLGPDLRAVLLEGHPPFEPVTGNGLCRAFGQPGGTIGQGRLIRATRLGAIVGDDGKLSKIRDTSCTPYDCDLAVETLTCDLAVPPPASAR